MTVRKTARYRLAEALAGHRRQMTRIRPWLGAASLMLLTATPHMGKPPVLPCGAFLSRTL